ncbi:MAG TPA: folate-binding protein [Stellaceae bacterium]|nr:folate-binding protein [Stellaceae bacterium]
MASGSYALLDDRGVLEVAGADRLTFLQGLVSNDVRKLGPNRALYAAFLTPQGKYLHDFFLVEHGDVIWLECERARLPDLLRRLSMFKLRAKVSLTDVSANFTIAAAFGADAGSKLGLPADLGAAASFGDGIAYIDPRLAELGARLIRPRSAGMRAIEAAGLVQAEPGDYDRLRLSLGVADGSRDLAVEKAILLEAGFDELHGVDWDKGCYMGQELTARTKYRALIKKRLMPVKVDGPLPAPGTVVTLDDQEAGETRSGRSDLALALLRLESVEKAAKTGAPLLAGEARLTPIKPAWARF